MVTLYVEGGGDRKNLRTECRHGFMSLMEKAGVGAKRVVACGSRKDAYDSYCTAIENGEDALLLVDSEAPVAPDHQQRPWAHLKRRTGDGWTMPRNGDESHCHLMVQVMETWFLADREALARFFGQGFNPKKLPAGSNPLETVPKTEVYECLKNATRDCRTKGEYGKGAHSFQILAQIDPRKVAERSPWAKRFLSAPELARASAPEALDQGDADHNHPLPEWSAEQNTIIQHLDQPRSAEELATLVGPKVRAHVLCSRELKPLLSAGLVAMTLPEKPRSPKQQYKLTDSGLKYQASLKQTTPADEPESDPPG